MIDFAARNGIEYINIDDGWSPLHNFDKVNKNLELPEVLAYAEKKGVGVFIWCVWQSLEKPSLEKNLDKFKAMGVAGLKVDFFDRNDQRVVEFVEHLADEAAKRKLLLNLHGMYPPSGLTHTYPNVLNTEGVLGLEYNKFSDRCTPLHNLTIPFVRNSVGPMDYTPGGMRHIRPDNFEKSWGNPHVMSSRAQQAAMYIIYHGGLQMLADSPVFFERDSLMLNFIKDIPVSWDEVYPLSGKTGEYIVLARRKENVWYLAGMTADEAQNFELPLSFLPEGNFEMQLLEDGNKLSELSQSTQKVTKNTVLNIRIKALGGFVAQIVKR
jgi:alpha-glucosidase